MYSRIPFVRPAEKAPRVPHLDRTGTYKLRIVRRRDSNQEEKGLGQKLQAAWGAGAALGLGLGIGFAILLGMAFFRLAESQTPPALTVKSTLARNFDATRESIAAARQSFGKFVQAANTAERLEHVLNAEKAAASIAALEHADLTEEFHPMGEDLQDASAILTQEEKRRGLLALAKSVTPGKPPLLMFFGRDAHGRPKLEPEFFMQQLTQKLWHFAASPVPGSRATFRAAIGLERNSPALHGRRPKFGSHFIYVKVTPWESPDAPLVFQLDSRTALAERLWQETQAHRDASRFATVEFTWKDDGRGPILCLTQLLSLEMLGSPETRLNLTAEAPNVPQLANRSSGQPNLLPIWLASEPQPETFSQL